MRHQKKILVVDDDAIICKLLVTFLQYHGFDAGSVYSGEDALKAIKADRFHAIITDLKMGQVSGHDVIRYARKVAPETVLIMMTGCSKEENKTKAFENGVDTFFNKPFAMSELLKSLPSPTQDSRDIQKQTHVSM